MSAISMTVGHLSLARAARLFTIICDVLIPAGLLVVLAERLGFVDMRLGAFEALGRCVFVLVLALALLHAARLLTTGRHAFAAVVRSVVYLLLLIAFVVYTISC